MLTAIKFIWTFMSQTALAALTIGFWSILGLFIWAILTVDWTGIVNLLEAIINNR